MEPRFASVECESTIPVPLLTGRSLDSTLFRFFLHALDEWSLAGTVAYAFTLVESWVQSLTLVSAAIPSLRT